MEIIYLVFIGVLFTLFFLTGCNGESEENDNIKVVSYTGSDSENSMKLDREQKMEYDFKNELFHMKDELKLSDEQFDQFKQVLEKQFNERKQLRKLRPKREEGPPDPEKFQEFRKKMEEINRETDKKLKGILTEEQLKKYEQIQEQKRKERREHRKQYRPN